MRQATGLGWADAARRSAGLMLGLVVAASAPAGEVEKAAPRAPEFNRDVRPILSEACFPCHGPDKAKRKAALRLDDRDAAIAAEAIVPGRADASGVIDRILSDDPDQVMPPPESNKALSASQKETLRRWVDAGAEYQPHWAYVPPRKAEPPAVTRREWVRNPVDAFVLYGLEARDIAPSPEADRRTLIRRLSLDLTGLPPTPREVEEFVEDEDPKAYESQVDRLLASPHYGERMAVPWLDLVRFADTVGYHGDQNVHVSPYRDYVIDAFNANMPFDRFTAEQLAGDLLPDPTPAQRVASGFNRLNMVTREGGAQPGEYLAKYAADRVRTVSTTWLGSTMGCAECHDHKYDPFHARDFYRLAAFFADTTQWGVYSDYEYTPNPDLRGYTNDHPFPPEIEVDSPALIRRRDRLNREIGRIFAAASARVDADPARRAECDDWATACRAALDEAPDGWLAAQATFLPGAPSKDKDGKEIAAGAEAQPDGSIAWTGPARRGDSRKFRLDPPPGWVASIRLDVLPSPETKGMVTRDGTPTALVQLSASLKSGESSRPLAFWHADAGSKEERYADGSAVIGVVGGWKTAKAAARAPQSSVWLLDTPVRVGDGSQIIVTVKSDNVSRIKFSVSPIAIEDPRSPAVDDALLDALNADPGTRTAEQVDRLRAAFALGTGRDAEAKARYRAAAKALLECRDGKAWAVVTKAREPLVTRVLPRGNWQDETGEVVAPGVPHFLPQPAADKPRLDRLDLARWITAKENPLTARVFVNRLWKQFFGTGLSAVMEDVGAQGEWPSHPELLDWLAVEFRDNGWDVKRMVKLLVMSATYRQDARLRRELREVDPGNRLLASQSPRRLEAEFVRDNALSIAGLLDGEMGGPASHPYQPAGYYAILQFPDRDYVADRDRRQYRRGVYTHWQRTFLHPMMANFDAPSREECTASRIVANTPQQALTLLNDPTFVEAARATAARVLSPPAVDDAGRIDALFRLALARPPKPAEARSLAELLVGQRSAYRDRPEDAAALLQVGFAPTPRGVDPVEMAAWASVCRVVLNLHETITRY